jgi:hypothetical protein
MAVQLRRMGTRAGVEAGFVTGFMLDLALDHHHYQSPGPRSCTWMNSVPGGSSHWGLRRSSKMTEVPLLARLEPRLKPR